MRVSRHFLALALVGLCAAGAAFADGPSQTLLDYQARARAACPAIYERTKASPDYEADSTDYTAEECPCLSDQITERLFDDESGERSGGYMAETDALTIAEAMETQQTLDDVLYVLMDGLGEDALNSALYCYGKVPGGDILEEPATPAPASNARSPHFEGASKVYTPGTATQVPPTSGEIATASREVVVPTELYTYQDIAFDLCPDIDAASYGSDTSGYFTCGCAASQITEQAWSDGDLDYTGPFMSEADAKLIVDTLRSSSNMAEASERIYGGLSEDGQSVLSACFSK